MAMTDPARYAADAAQAVGAVFEDLDNGEGYLFRVSKGSHFLVAGAGSVCSFPVNSATAFTLSRDKAHTKTVLREAGIPVIPGRLFFAHKRRAGLRGPGREIEDARAYAAQLGYPVFVKPNHGSRGNFAEIVQDDAQLADYAARVAVEFESFLLEPVVDGTEHRVMIHDGRVLFHSVKQTPDLVGDGQRTLGELLAEFNAQLSEQGISPYPASILAGQDGEVLESGGFVVLPGRRNLSAAGTLERISMEAPHVLAQMSARAVAALGLRIGAVDLFDLSEAGDLSKLAVIEVNGNPGLRTLELAGRMDLIRGIWVAMLNELLEA